MRLTEVNFDTMAKIAQLKEGDIIKIKSGLKEKECTFVSNKQVNMVCIMDGKAYNVPKTLFVDIVKKAEPKKIAKINLKPNELFVIKNGNKVCMYAFIENKNGYLWGFCPVTKVRVKAPINMFVSSIKDLQKQVNEELTQVQ